MNEEIEQVYKCDECTHTLTSVWRDGKPTPCRATKEDDTECPGTMRPVDGTLHPSKWNSRYTQRCGTAGCTVIIGSDKPIPRGLLCRKCLREPLGLKKEVEVDEPKEVTTPLPYILPSDATPRHPLTRTGDMLRDIVHEVDNWEPEGIRVLWRYLDARLVALGEDS